MLIFYSQIEIVGGGGWMIILNFAPLNQWVQIGKQNKKKKKELKLGLIIDPY